MRTPGRKLLITDYIIPSPKEVEASTTPAAEQQSSTEAEPGSQDGSNVAGSSTRALSAAGEEKPQRLFENDISQQLLPLGTVSEVLQRLIEMRQRTGHIGHLVETLLRRIDTAIADTEGRLAAIRTED